MEKDVIEKKIKNRISRAIAEKIFPGCVVGVVKTGGERLVVPCGNFTFDAGRSVKKDSIFDVASITKVIPTTSLALMLADAGKLRLDDKLITFVPEFRNSDKDDVLIRHLLTQTLHFDFHLSALKEKSPDETLNIIFTHGFASRPGTKFAYSNATSILLGLVIERILHKPLDQLGREYFFEPLGMARTLFRPLEKFAKNEIVPTEIQEWRGGLVQGEVHDESACALGKKMVVGSAGLFSTAPDMLNFLEMLLYQGTVRGRKYFSPEIVAQIHTNQIGGLGESEGLGWELNQPRYMGKYCGAETFGKTGFTGCCLICDIRHGVGVVILSNYTYPKRKPDGALINNLRSDMADIVFGSII